jgi:hypothetical protein
MKPILIALLVTSAFASADEAKALREIYAERDQEIRASLEAAEDDLALVTQKIAALKTRLGEPKQPEDGLIIVEVRDAGIFVNDVSKTAQELNEELRGITARQQFVHVRLTAAADIDWSKIRPALQACIDAKIWRFDFHVADAQSKPASEQGGGGQPATRPESK